MPTIQENIARVDRGRRLVKEHCMAARVEEHRTHVLVIFPPGYFPDGVRVTTANGKAWAYDQALIRMERAWQEARL